MVGKVLRAWLALCEQGYTPSHRMNLHLSNVGPVRAGIYHVDNSAPRQRLPCCPASTIFAGWRQSVLPVHLLGLAPLLGSVGPVAGDVKLQDDGVVHHPVDCRGVGRWRPAGRQSPTVSSCHRRMLPCHGGVSPFWDGVILAVPVSMALTALAGFSRRLPAPAEELAPSCGHVCPGE